MKFPICYKVRPGTVSRLAFQRKGSKKRQNLNAEFRLTFISNYNHEETEYDIGTDENCTKLSVLLSTIKELVTISKLDQKHISFLFYYWRNQQWDTELEDVAISHYWFLEILETSNLIR